MIAGEASGDLHASQVMAALRRLDPDAAFTYLGGDMMHAACGTAPVIDYRDMAFMGFSEVLRNLGKISANLRAAKDALRQTRPDVLVLVDYPSFNLKVAAEAHRLGIPVAYYISPKVWAWKEWRVRAIKRLVDRMLVIFPFEVDYYRDRHGYSATYVGNPSVGEIDAALAAMPAREDFLRAHGIDPERPYIALLPGSRRGEIRNNMSVMLEAARRFGGYSLAIAAAPGIDDGIYAPYQAEDVRIVRDATMPLLAYAAAALVTSGTATLEAALASTPQVACYRANGSRLSYAVMHRLLKVDYVTLPNLIARRQVIPEMLLHHCTADNVARELAAILPVQAPATLTRDSAPGRAAMLDGYAGIRRALGTADAADAAAHAILALASKGK